MSARGGTAQPGPAAAPGPERGRTPRTTPPASSCRLQLHAGFDFDDAARIVPYLARLGVGAVYTSPLLAAAAGSTHGYDIVDHARVNPELGGEEGFDAFTRTLRAHGLALIMDFVPNHMGVEAARANRWWWDVLENGTASRFARYFDIDWAPVKRELAGRVLLPVLGDAYGRVLERGELALETAPGGRIDVRYFDRAFPLDPGTLPSLFAPAAPGLAAVLGARHPAVQEWMSILASLDHLPGRDAGGEVQRAEREREAHTARARIARLMEDVPEIAVHVAARIEAVNGVPGDPASFDALHALLDAQAYRLAHWRTSFHEINYRRFFDVNGLAALRMEEPDVFDATHARVLEWVRQGRLDGLRLDHVDGLFDPAAYLARLRRAVDEARGAGTPFYLVVEKILSPGESLRRDWPIDGTTGYDFMNDVNGLFVDGTAERRMTAIARRFTGAREPFADLVYEAKRDVMDSTLASELNVLAHALNGLSERSRRDRDFTLNSLRTMLREVVACFPVYRTYLAPGETDADDARVVRHAIATAQRRNPDTDPSIFGFLDRVLLGGDDAIADPAEAARRRRFAMQFQQFTGPVKAKGLEDTAFYRSHVLVSLDEVGGAPQRFGRTPAAFHAANATRREAWPAAMLCTATHDMKRGEDVRTRIDALSEIPDAWAREVFRWTRINSSAHTRPDDGAPAPDRSDEYLFYQTLLGAWPAGAVDAAALAERLTAYMLKATREAKRHTSWIHPNAEYEDATRRFVTRVLTGRVARRFLPAFEPFQRRIAAAGMVQSLAQVVLKTAAPGVPDFYQGTEGWDLSLVDPDNRRPVDFAARARALDALEPLLDGAPPAEALAALLATWPDGRVKTFVTAAALRTRAARAALFLEGDYLPVHAAGEHAAHVVAFARTRHGEAALALAPRLVLGLSDDAPPLGEIWGDTRLVLPEAIAGRRLRDAFGGATLPAASGGPRLADLLRHFPAALFVTETRS